MKQELNNSNPSTNSETKQENKLKNTTMNKSNQELQIIKNLDILQSNLIEGRTLLECIKDKTINPSQTSLMKFYNILKKNPELEIKVAEARKLGVQTLIDKLMQVFQHQEVENPNQILWIREKVKFVQYVAGHITDLYSDNKVQNVKTDTSLNISWQSEPDLIDVNVSDIPDKSDPLLKDNS
jgi:hypothetical protein